MKSKIVAAVFIILAVGLSVFFLLSRKIQKTGTDNSTQANIVMPKNPAATNEDSSLPEGDVKQESFTSFVTLSSSETLLSTLMLDFDNDTYDDQMVVVRKADSPYLCILVGLYDPETKKYERISEISTNISKTGTFACSSMDVLGNHSQALIYQGMEDSGDYVMNIYICKGAGKEAELLNIGAFASDGTVFIQQSERSDSYELGLSRGESFSVWVYSSDKKEEEDGTTTKGLNQIQTEYKWNPASERYEFNRSTTVTASRLAARELSRIQDGTVETFASYMDGLWYKTSNTDSTIRYLYFNYKDREIIFLNGATEEVYAWEDSKLRHNGIYLTTTNTIISSLQRRFDIMLSNVDEIWVTVRDDVHMDIKESSLWDGQYKKTGPSYIFNADTPEAGISNFSRKILPYEWKTDDENSFIKFDGVKYSAKTGSDEEAGIFSVISVGEDYVIQLRPVTGYSSLETEYKLTFGTKIITEVEKRKTVEKTVVDENTLIMIPVKVTPKECFVTDGRSWQFVKSVSASSE